MTKKRKILIGIIIFFILGQFVRPEKNINKTISGNDITKIYNIPPKILDNFKNACYDCHSNHTKYPSYSNIFPISWLMYNHIAGGKKHLNFSEFGKYSDKKKKILLNDIGEMIQEGEMPLSSYLLLHPEAKLSSKEKEEILYWLDTIME